MEGFMGYLEVLDKKLHEKNKITKLLEKAEKATGVRRLYIVLGLAGFWALYMILGHVAELVCNSIGFGYPAYKSICALENRKKEESTKWLTYWVTFSSFRLAEFFSGLILDYIPFYWLLKVLFLIWCFAPIPNNGSHFLHTKIIRPLFLNSQEKIDEMRDNISSSAREMFELGVATGVFKRDK